MTSEAMVVSIVLFKCVLHKSSIWYHARGTCKDRLECASQRDLMNEAEVCLLMSFSLTARPEHLSNHQERRSDRGSCSQRGPNVKHR